MTDGPVHMPLLNELRRSKEMILMPFRETNLRVGHVVRPRDRDHPQNEFRIEWIRQDGNRVLLAGVKTQDVDGPHGSHVGEGATMVCYSHGDGFRVIPREIEVLVEGVRVCGEPFFDRQGEPRICTYTKDDGHDRHCHYNGAAGYLEDR